MKGSPLLRALVAFALIALAGVPLWKLTTVDGAVAAPVEVAATAAKIVLQLTFSTPPNSFGVLHLNKPVWSQASPDLHVEKEVELSFPDEGVDLQFRVSWPADLAYGAMRVRLSDPKGVEHEKTVWGQGDMVEIVTFP